MLNIKSFSSPMLVFSLAAILSFALSSCDGDKAENLLSIVEDSERGLSSLKTSSSNVALAVGESTQISVQGFYYTGVDAKFTEPVKWVSLDPAVASVGSDGDITAVSEGVTEIQVSWRTYSASTNVSVNEAALQSIELSSLSLEMDACRSASLSATGIYSDGTSRQLPDTVNWSLLDTTLGSIEINPDFSITITSLGHGSTSLDVSVENVNASLPVVMLDTLTSIAITPDLSTLTPGERVALLATGNYNDVSEFDISSNAAWLLENQLPDDSIAELDLISFDSVKLDTFGIGTATLEASCGGVSATTPVVIALAPEFESLLVTNGIEVELGAGEAVSLEVFGVYADGSTQDLSLLVDWSLPVMNSELFTLSISDISAGVITADANMIVEQSIVIIATYEELTTTTTVYGERGVENTLQSLDVKIVDSLGNESSAPTQVPYLLVVGNTKQLHVDAAYLTGSERVLDANVFWSNVNPSIATVDSLGVVSAIAAGQTTISASFGGMTFQMSVSVSEI
jgi:hypothetical protein